MTGEIRTARAEGIYFTPWVSTAKVAERMSTGGATTELLKVVEKGQVDEVAALLGDDVNVADNLGWTPLHEAASSNRDTSVCELLLCRGAHVNQPNEVPSHPLCAILAHADASHCARAVWRDASPHGCW